MINKNLPFIFGRMGNKSTDIKYFIEHLPSDCNVICEPFGGTFAVSRCVYYDNKYDKHVNDLDVDLYNIYVDPDKYLKEKELLLEIANNNKDENGRIITKKVIEEMNKSTVITNKKMLKDNFFINGVNARMRKTDKGNKEALQLMKTINFYNEDYMTFMSRFIDNKDAFIFIDPPYLFSDNSSYNPQLDQKDMTHILVYLLELFNNPTTKCKIMLIINKLDIISYMFNNYIKGEYCRIYQLHKKKSVHLIICNY